MLQLSASCYKEKDKRGVSWHPGSYLFVHYDVDDGVVDGRALGEERRDGHEDGPEVRALVGEDVEGDAGVGEPADQEGDDHDDDHASHFFLCLLGGGRLLLLGSSLQAEGNRNVMEPVHAAPAGTRGQGSREPSCTSGVCYFPLQGWPGWPLEGPP